MKLSYFMILAVMAVDPLMVHGKELPIPRHLQGKGKGGGDEGSGKKGDGKKGGKDGKDGKKGDGGMMGGKGGKDGMMGGKDGKKGGKGGMMGGKKGGKDGKGGPPKGGKGGSAPPSCRKGEVAIAVLFDDIDTSGGSDDFDYNGAVLCYSSVSDFERWNRDPDDFEKYIDGNYGHPTSIYAVESTTCFTEGDSKPSFGNSIATEVSISSSMRGHLIRSSGTPNLCDVARGEFGIDPSDKGLFSTQLTAAGLTMEPDFDEPSRQLQEDNNSGVTVPATGGTGSLAGFLSGASAISVDIGGLRRRLSGNKFSSCAGQIYLWELPYTPRAVDELNQVE